MAYILVVDDAAEIRVLCREALGRVDHDVITVSSGDEALTFLDRAERLPDLVLLDVQMPKMDGWTVLREIRSRPRTEDLRVVMFSVRAHRDDVVEGWRLGCDGYVGKPVNLDAWIRAIEVVLARHESERLQQRQEALRELTSANAFDEL